MITALEALRKKYPPPYNAYHANSDFLDGWDAVLEAIAADMEPRTTAREVEGGVVWDGPAVWRLEVIDE